MVICMMAIAPESKGGLILCKRYHAELVGPGAAVGGLLDIDCSDYHWKYIF